jgi:diguanylate cyclase (GGDEF)-like protein
LIVDDSSVIHEVLEVRLQPEGLVLHHAFGGGEALQKAVDLRPDLILLDADMPDLSGLEVCRRLKANPRTEPIPIIFISGGSQLFAKVEAFDAGAIDYVGKPFDPIELRARVRAALRTKRYQDLLLTRAQIDGLTGLWNRSYFDRRLEDEMAAARRYGRSVALAMIDLDHFKALNDRHGHPFGDRALQAVGEALTATVRTSDAACRYGGDEFALILTETDGPGAQRAAERVLERIVALGLAGATGEVQVSATIGVAATSAFTKPEEIRAGSLIGLADEALYRAKKAGRGQVFVLDGTARPEDLRVAG